MENKQAFAKALRTIRKGKGLTQEDFSEISSRTYLSILERGLKSPTLEKIDELAKAMGVHPLTLLLLTYTNVMETHDTKKLLETVAKEVNSFVSISK